MLLLYTLNELMLNIWKDKLTRYIFSVITIIIFLFGYYFSFLFALTLYLFFINGCFFTAVLLINRHIVSKYGQLVKDFFGYQEYSESTAKECDVCGTSKCKRHIDQPIREPWNYLLYSKKFDLTIENFYNKIIDRFVMKWFSHLSNDGEFILYLKQHFREATCRLILKIKEINGPMLITNKLLPTYFAHYELIIKMLHVENIPADKLVKNFVDQDYPIHPAVLNRQTEIHYLHEISKLLIPRLFTNTNNVNSNIFFNLMREIFSYWVLLPLMDVISDPNLINLLIIILTDMNNSKILLKTDTSSNTSTEKVVLLENFIKTNVSIDPQTINAAIEFKVLGDQHKLYAFMQFLKKEGAVDILRFYLDVDNLNNELLDPRITTDPTKLSSLYQQSEHLLTTYKKILHTTDVDNLLEAHDNVKTLLQNKWCLDFFKTSEYFNLIYGDTEPDKTEKRSKIVNNNQTKFSKLKGGMRSGGANVDGTPIEATEIPTVWDALNEAHVQHNSSNNIYNSVTLKLRKEKGQSLDNFMTSFMHSIEQSPDIGEDVIDVKSDKFFKDNQKPGVNVVFGNLFEIRKPKKISSISKLVLHGAKGPSQCFIYILVKILKSSMLLIRITLACCCVSQKTVDSLLCKFIEKILQYGLEESRLASLIELIQKSLFTSTKQVPSPHELLRRQQIARQSLKNACDGLESVSDVLQSPVLNKHLMYCLLDILLIEMYPEFAAKDN